MKYILSLFLLLFLAACGDDDNTVGTTPQDNCILNGGPQFCNNNPFTQGHYPINNGFYSGFNNGGFANLNGCGSGYRTVGHPQWGLNCVPHFNGNFNLLGFQNFNIPLSCRNNHDCGGTGTCRIQAVNYAGVCVRY